jgi:hypothetical protein
MQNDIMGIIFGLYKRYSYNMNELNMFKICFIANKYIGICNTSEMLSTSSRYKYIIYDRNEKYMRGKNMLSNRWSTGKIYYNDIKMFFDEYASEVSSDPTNSIDKKYQKIWNINCLYKTL